MKKEKRERILKIRQELLTLLDDSKWDLIEEKYKEASETIDNIKTIMDHLIDDLAVDTL